MSCALVCNVIRYDFEKIFYCAKKILTDCNKFYIMSLRLINNDKRKKQYGGLTMFESATNIFKAAEKVSKNAESNAKTLEKVATDAAIYMAALPIEKMSDFIPVFFGSATYGALRSAFAKKSSLLVNGVKDEKVDKRGRVLRLVDKLFIYDSRNDTATVNITDKSFSREKAKERERELVDSALLRFWQEEQTTLEKIKAHVKALHGLKASEQQIIKLFRELLPEKRR